MSRANQGSLMLFVSARDENIVFAFDIRPSIDLVGVSGYQPCKRARGKQQTQTQRNKF